jgi:1,4-alpha-glucan branching enzyme
MNKTLLTLVALLMGLFSHSQLLSWTPDFPQDNSTLVITLDATKGNAALKDFANTTDVYMHLGVITNLSTGPTDWKYVVTTWATTNVTYRATFIGSNKYQYTINNIRSFFGVPGGETIKTVNVLFRNGTGSIKHANTDGTDMYIPIYSSAPAIRLTLPVREPKYVPVPEPITKTVGQTVDATAVTSASGDITLKFNGATIQSANGASTISASPTIAAFGNQKILAEAVIAGNTVKDSIEFFIAPPSTVAALPANVQDGINYITNDSVVLVLYAPNKSRVSVIGEFNNWTESTPFQMKVTPDFKRFWVGVGKLTPGQEYAFQYLVDGTLRVGEPYCEKILDKNNDPFIPAANYPGLKTFPAAASGNIVSILQTAQTPFTWTANSYTRPNKKDLIVYELHLRDFLAARNWQTLTDTLNYLKNLGINAIELMPFTEFEGNDSWGYNPFYFFAPDKAYGTENALKTFIDEAHKKGMAVILDAVLNQTTGASPLAALYWNGALNRPAADNPWLNQTATHPFSVFDDFNHESEATKYHVARFIRYWLSEYKLDGFRWDLSKGFTQKNCGGDLGCWNAFDQSRINIWQRYYDSMQVVSPGSYCILEHLGNDDEEAELAKRGMMLWGKMTDQYNDNSMGFSGNANLDRSYWINRWAAYNGDGFLNDKPHVVVYAESHDEERTMYKNLKFGNSSGGYNVKDLNTALARNEAMAAIFLMTPGPKMLWQFQELGYEKSINLCADGVTENSNCRTSAKPVLWNYYTNANRKKLYDVFAALNKLRGMYPNTFNSKSIVSPTNLGSNLNKVLVLNTNNSSDIKVLVVANFNVTAQSVAVTFPTAGTWYSYLTGTEINATGGSQNINLQPGEYFVYTDKKVNVGTSVRDQVLNNRDFRLSIYPNPVNQVSTVQYELPESGKVTITVTNITGQNLGVINRGFQLKGLQNFNLNSSSFGSAKLVPGNYLLQVRVNNKVRIEKFVVQR